MFRNVLFEMWISQFRDQGHDDHEDRKESETYIDDQANRFPSNEGLRFVINERRDAGLERIHDDVGMVAIGPFWRQAAGQIKITLSIT